MIRDYEINPEHRKNPHASLYRFPQSPLAPTEQEQYSWALNDYFDSVLRNGTVFPSYLTHGYANLDAVRRAENEASKNGGWLSRPLYAMASGLDEINKQEQLNQIYKIPVVNNVMESIRQNLEKKIQGDLKSAITHKKIGVKFPYAYGDEVEENLNRRYPLEKQLIEGYLRSRFGN